MPKSPKTCFFRLLFFVILFGLVELIAHNGLRSLEKRYQEQEFYLKPQTLNQRQTEVLQKLLAGETAYSQYDVDLGWSIKTQGSSPLYQANSQGLRADRDYDFKVPPGMIRLSCFGDSYTHGDDVLNQETWQHYAQTQMPGCEFLNFGVGGYGLDQAFMRYQKVRAEFESHVVLMGFLSQNIYRHVNAFRPFLQPRGVIPLAKPRFALSASGGLERKANPAQSIDLYRELLASPESVLPRLGRDDPYYQMRCDRSWLDFLSSVKLIKCMAWRWEKSQFEPVKDQVFDITSPAYKITLEIFLAFRQRVLDDQATPVVVLFPEKQDLITYQERGQTKYHPLKKDLLQKGLLVIDVLEAFKAVIDQGKLDDLFGSSNHYSPLGNQKVAAHLIQKLKGYGVLSR